MPQKIQNSQQPESAQKPMRRRILSELGQSLSLTSGNEAFARLDPGALAANPSAENGPRQTAPAGDVLFLGLGPDPARLPALLRESGWSGGGVYYLECPDFAAQMPPEWRSGIPGDFQALPAAEYPGYSAGYCEWPDPVAPMELSGIPDNKLGRVKHVWQYVQSARLFPSFWGPLLGSLKLRALDINASPVAANSVAASPGAGDIAANPSSSASPASSVNPARPASPGNPASRHIILVGTEHSLLHLELRRAFQQLGCSVSTLPPTNNGNMLARLLQKRDIERPALFLSLNCEGFGALGETFYLLQAAGIPCATWFVDNPWYSLSGLRAPFWKRVRLFCTDASFVPQLKACGADYVDHLPLAVDPLLFTPSSQKGWSGQGGRSGRMGPAFPLLFVGRSAFPGKERFFAGLSVPPELTAQALHFLERGRLPERPWPDFHWWAEWLELAGSDLDNLWIGKEARRAGLGAENATAVWRAECLKAALPFNPVIYGDAGWHALLPAGVQVHEPVDYYHGLPRLYAAAEFTLNATSLLLSAGLNQRHFDVWAAGGFLITDYNPGLDIFPEELVKAITFRKKSEIPELLIGFRNNGNECRALKAAWREEILARHCYAHRIKRMLEILDI